MVRLQISFGSIFWPPEPEYIEELVDALVEKKISFVGPVIVHLYNQRFLYGCFQILSTASPVAKLSDALIDKIKTSGFGITSPWCPQQYILNHPVRPQIFVTLHIIHLVPRLRGGLSHIVDTTASLKPSGVVFPCMYHVLIEEQHRSMTPTDLTPQDLLAF